MELHFLIPSVASPHMLVDVEDSGFDGDDGSDDEKGAILSKLPRLLHTVMSFTYLL